MNIPVINILHLQEREDRVQNYLDQMNGQMAPFRVWLGFTDVTPWKAISRGHKQIVSYAKDQGHEFCIIAEDDINFTSKKSWATYVKKRPKDYDMYFGGISGGEVNEKTGLIKDVFSGMFLYTIHQRFYDCFLAADEEKNIDRWLSGTGLDKVEKMLGRKPVYKVCYPIVATCIDGFSDNSKKIVDHETNFFFQYKKL